jgi:hypothetical protein
LVSFYYHIFVVAYALKLGIIQEEVERSQNTRLLEGDPKGMGCANEKS